MPSPTLSNVHVNAPLTNMSVAYVQDQSHFIADKVFPNIPVTKQSDRYYVYSRADFNRDEMQERAPGTESAGGGYNLDNTPTYYAPVNAYHKDIDDQIRENSDSVLGPDRDATIFVTQKALIRRERLWAMKYFQTGVWATQATGVASAPAAGQFIQWSDAGSTPIEDIRAAKRRVLELTGFEPNKITLGKAVYDALVDHPDIVDRVKYGQTPGKPAQANASTLAQLFELDEVLVSKAVFNAGAKGADYADSATREKSQFISGPNALLAYVTPTPSIMQPTAGYTFSWSNWFGATGMGFRIKKFRIERLESDRVEIQMAFDQKVVGADLGYFFSNAVATS
ncbi:hypothetical protein GCM10011491_30900 [Brucella endophytica]|uniref:Major capsid protein GpE n=1 Tax=Brucella endophytica TaxID=1963359 RepID=A0A916WHJ3_9HYPH|nr:major capsid protein [Brucella endophytica]GGB00518.1 hypothetical protein GCM10011491_30900 [Brucella endophytica]